MSVHSKKDLSLTVVGASAGASVDCADRLALSWQACLISTKAHRTATQKKQKKQQQQQQEINVAVILSTRLQAVLYILNDGLMDPFECNGTDQIMY